VALAGSYTVEPLFMDPPVSGEMLAADLAHNRLYIITAQHRLIVVNPDGTGRVELADGNPDTVAPLGRLRVAVNESSGRVYWSQIKTYYLTDIVSANPDGSDVQKMYPLASGRSSWLQFWRLGGYIGTSLDGWVSLLFAVTVEAELLDVRRSSASTVFVHRTYSSPESLADQTAPTSVEEHRSV
jgi:hypothetical protein